VWNWQLKWASITTYIVCRCRFKASLKILRANHSTGSALAKKKVSKTLKQTVFYDFGCYEVSARDDLSLTDLDRVRWLPTR
jgi:hypothetical protein